jgi:hypothetical protein
VTRTRWAARHSPRPVLRRRRALLPCPRKPRGAGRARDSRDDRVPDSLASRWHVAKPGGSAHRADRRRPNGMTRRLAPPAEGERSRITVRGRGASTVRAEPA